jgi:hypothetical protein
MRSANAPQLSDRVLRDTTDLLSFGNTSEHSNADQTVALDERVSCRFRISMCASGRAARCTAPQPLTIATERTVPMADETSASVIPLHQVPLSKKARTSAKTSAGTADKIAAKIAEKIADRTDDGSRAKKNAPRAKTNRQRKKAAPVEAAPPPSSDHLIPLDFSSADDAPSAAQGAKLPVPAGQAQQPHQSENAPAPVVMSRTIAQSNTSLAHTGVARASVVTFLLTTAALALAIVGMTMNGWFARSLGSSDIAGWLFLAIGVTADLVALVMPSCAARLWQRRQRATSLAAWAVWLMTFAFAVTAGVGFASTNITDVTTARASRITPAVQAAQGALTDAMAARDRECKGGVGKFCREREAAVNERRQALDSAMRSVERTADPQTQAAIRIVAWLSHGALRPSDDDFAMLRLVLLALLPQIGGILLMVSRSSEA